MDIIVSSNNKNKIKEIKEILKNTDINLLSLNDINFNKEIIEDGLTFEENAYIKARAIYDIYKMPVISDDSGLICNGLNGKPGVYSHRYAGINATDEENNLKLIRDLKNVKDKSCYFKCVICFINSKGETYYATGTVDGCIIDTHKGNNGFGYDPYFYIKSLDKTMAELDMNEKNKISHRAKALLKLKEILNENTSC